MNAEGRFKLVVSTVVALGRYPTPTLLNVNLHPGRRLKNNLNDRECRWRREICAVIGFRLRGKNA